MADNDEQASARVPVRPSTLDELAELAGKRRTYDDLLQDMIRVYKKHGGDK
jgi:hypothetical protein